MSHRCAGQRLARAGIGSVCFAARPLSAKVSQVINVLLPLSPQFSPAEAAIEAAGAEVATHEMSQLIRLVARRLPADRDAVRHALCDVRRKTWRARLNTIVSRTARLWILPADVQAAVNAIDDPEVTAETLEATLDR